MYFLTFKKRLRKESDLIREGGNRVEMLNLPEYTLLYKSDFELHVSYNSKTKSN